MKIFLSYTTRDSIITLNQLKSLVPILNSFGTAYVDLLHNDSIEKQQRVEDELTTADLLILLKSKSILNSKWVAWELKKANELNIPIHSIPITNCEDVLPQVLRNLPNRISQILANRKCYPNGYPHEKRLTCINR